MTGIGSGPSVQELLDFLAGADPQGRVEVSRISEQRESSWTVTVTSRVVTR